MARITVEDCLEVVDNRFELVMMATKRARQLSKGADPLVEGSSDKPTVLALREIASGKVTNELISEIDKQEREKAERPAPIRRDGRAVLAQEPQRARDVAAPLLWLLIQRGAQRFSFLDRVSRLAAIEVRSERDEAGLREPVAGLAERLR